MNTATLWPRILAAPGDAGLKAQYVEALAQEDDPRAELFRLAAQIQSRYGKDVADVLRHPAGAAGALREEPVARYLRLLADWRAEFDARAGAWGATVTFVGGWPSEITLTARDFVRHAAEIGTALPLQHLNLQDIGDAPEVFAVPEFAQIASLDGSRQPWAGALVTALAASPRLDSLRWLDLSDTRLTDADVETLAASPRLRGLEYVNLAHNPCRDPTDRREEGYDQGVFVGVFTYPRKFGSQLEKRHGAIPWLHVPPLVPFPPSRYSQG